jgi:DNA adenine methylase
LSVPHPFLKWAGGKSQLLPPLLAAVKEFGHFGAYHEPFLGGGALFFGLWHQGLFATRRALLSDTNPKLVETWQVVRDQPEALIRCLQDHAAQHDEAHFYAVREADPATPVERAARIVYLNRTCFNGLYRENSKGRFNVPYGRYAKPTICDEANLLAASKTLAEAEIEARSFESVFEKVAPDDLVYFDPPFVPLSTSSSFVAYTKGGFGEQDQIRLSLVFRELAARGVHVLLSNSMTDLVRCLYAGFRIEALQATRNVNCKAELRGPIAEALVRSTLARRNKARAGSTGLAGSGRPE